MKVIVVGGGLVGSLTTIMVAQQGHEVHLYELRKDIRKQPRYSGYSINLALSERGITSLRMAGIADEIIAEGLPMSGRMIHSHSGDQAAQAYGKKGQAIMSIDRRNLNEVLLSRAEEHSNVTLHFEHKCVRHDPEKGTILFDNNGAQVSATGDLFVGCDGAYSTMRRQIMRKTRMNFEQFYIPHGYKELTMPPAPDGGFLMSPGHLHIWPRSTFMMIALPNQDKTFTLTLFMPFSKFESITTKEDVMQFFEEEFPDSIPLIGREKLVADYMANPTSPLVQVKCGPYHFGKSLIIGDAAHAMVPFYGQGMNAGLEDVRVLKTILDSHDWQLEAALAAYSTARHPDAVAICDLAQYNYVEMRDSVNSSWYLFRKKVDALLHRLMPDRFIPLYSMVTFSTIPYSTVIRRKQAQDLWVNTTLAAMSAGLLGLAAGTAYVLGTRGKAL